MTLRFADRLLPGHPEHEGEEPYYRGTDFALALNDKIGETAHEVGPWNLDYPPGFPAEAMSSHGATLRLIQILLKLHGAKDVLEIGTFVGRSALYIAAALPDDGCVVTLEKGAEFADIAYRNVTKNAPVGKIRVLKGDAMDYQPDQMFDAVFIDGDKEHYLEYFRTFECVLRPGGLMLVDDCFFHGDVLNDEPVTAKGRGVKRFMDHVSGLDGWLKLAVPIGNGLMVMVRDASAT